MGAIACFALAVYYCFGVHPVLGIVVIVLLLTGLPIYLMYAIRLFPKTPLGKRLALRRPDPEAGAGDGVPEADEHPEWIGAEGVTMTVLRPSGTIRIGDKRIVATAEGELIPADTRVRVVKSTGLNVVVRPIEPVADE